MGLARKNPIRTLDSVLNFGAFNGCTIREVIDDQSCSYIQFYMDNVEGFEIDNETENYLRRHCHKRNLKCSCHEIF